MASLFIKAKKKEISPAEVLANEKWKLVLTSISNNQSKRLSFSEEFSQGFLAHYLSERHFKDLFDALKENNSLDFLSLK